MEISLKINCPKREMETLWKGHWMVWLRARYVGNNWVQTSPQPFSPPHLLGWLLSVWEPPEIVQRIHDMFFLGKFFPIISYLLMECFWLNALSWFFEDLIFLSWFQFGDPHSLSMHFYHSEETSKWCSGGLRTHLWDSWLTIWHQFEAVWCPKLSGPPW